MMDMQNTDLLANQTIVSVTSGPWDDAATWSEGRIPDKDDRVVISMGHEVSLPLAATVDRIGVHGVLSIPDDAAELRVNLLLVYPMGALRGGTVEAPVDGFEVIIRDTPIDRAEDPEQMGQGVVVYGEITLIGVQKRAFVRLAKDALAGDTSIEIEGDADGWLPGDRLVLPDTRQHVQKAISQGTSTTPVQLHVEEVIVQSVDGNVIVLEAPVQYDHKGSRYVDGTLFRRGHVANITRSVVIRSDNPNGTRGHVMTTARAKVDVRNVGLLHMGRTTAAPLFDLTNKIGRYPFHMHQCHGPVNPTNTGYQFRVQGNVVVDGKKWGIAIHDSHFGLVADNVVYDVEGAGIVTESGHEFGNEIVRNMTIKSGTTIASFPVVQYGGAGGPGRMPGFGDFGYAGDGFWISGNGNTFSGNVAANCAHSPFNWNGRGVGGFADFYPRFPKYRGADPADNAAHDDYTKPYRPGPEPPVRKDNEAYSCALGPWCGFSMHAGMWLRTDTWHIQCRGVYSARNRSAMWCTSNWINDPAISAQSAYSVNALDIEASTYLSGKLTFRDCIVEGYNVGMILPGTRGRVPDATAEIFEFIRGRLVNWVNVVETSGQDEKSTVFQSTKFDLLPNKPRASWISSPLLRMPATPQHFVGYINTGNLNACAVVLSRLISYDHDGSGVDMEYFLPEQAPDLVMPTRRVTANGVPMPDFLINCPTPGLTNAQCFIQHGVATLGKVATGTTQRPDVGGFLVPLDSTQEPPPIEPPVEPPVEPPALDDLELSIEGRRYRLTDIGEGATADGTIVLAGTTYELRRL